LFFLSRSSNFDEETMCETKSISEQEFTHSDHGIWEPSPANGEIFLEQPYLLGVDCSHKDIHTKIKNKTYVSGVDTKNNLECDHEIRTQKRQGTPK
jgi:hypothetical protein